MINFIPGTCESIDILLIQWTYKLKKKKKVCLRVVHDIHCRNGKDRKQRQITKTLNSVPVLSKSLKGILVFGENMPHS